MARNEAIRFKNFRDILLIVQIASPSYARLAMTARLCMILYHLKIDSLI